MAEGSLPKQPGGGAEAAQPVQALSFSLLLLCFYGYLGVFTPYASLFFEARGMSATEIGVLMSLMQVMRIFGPNLWGWVADRSGRRVLVLRLTATAALAAFCGMFFGQSFMHFFILMALVNTFTSAQTPLADALMLSELRGDLRLYGRLRLWGSVGFIAAVVAGGQLLDWHGIDLLPALAAALLALTVVSSMRLRDTSQGHDRREAPPLLSLMRRREVLAFFTSTCLMIAAHTALYVFYSLYLAQLGYSKLVIGLMWSLGVVAEIVFFYHQTPVFRHFGVQALMLGSLALAALRFAVIGLGAESLALLLLAQLLHAATFAAHHSASMMTLQRWFAGPLQASGQALFTSISYGVGGTFGGMALALCWDAFGPRQVYLLAAAMALGATLAAMLSYRWQPHPGGRN